jgi:hypothetical protein
VGSGKSLSTGHVCPPKFFQALTALCHYIRYHRSGKIDDRSGCQPDLFCTYFLRFCPNGLKYSNHHDNRVSTRTIVPCDSCAKCSYPLINPLARPNVSAFSKLSLSSVDDKRKKSRITDKRRASWTGHLTYIGAEHIDPSH